MTRAALLGLGVWVPACLTLDAMMPFHNAIHCSEVDDETCAAPETWDPYWDAICLVCEEPYAWDRDYDWQDTTLDSLEEIRAIDPASVLSAPLETEDGQATLDTHFIPAHGDVSALAQATVVYNHGNYAGLEHYLPRVRFLHELGFNVYVWDYRGYGKSEPEGVPTLEQWLGDAAWVFEHARSLAPDPDRMIIYGMSVGGIPAAEMAYRGPACAQVYEAAFTSVSERVDGNMDLSFPGSFITSGDLEAARKLAETSTPALILHGSEDDKFPVEAAHEFYDELPSDLPKALHIIDGAGHGIGGDGGVPEQGLGSYGDLIMGFLQMSASTCLVDTGAGS